MKAKKMLLSLLMLFVSSSFVDASSKINWNTVLQKAKGQVVYFNAWGGLNSINDYILWAAKESQKRFGITVKHVKITDAAEVVNRLLAEKTAGRRENGSVDLVWINGENFKALKKQNLLLSSYACSLPNYQFVDWENKPSILYDFTTPVDCLEVPWGIAQLVFMYDSEFLTNPPKNAQELLSFVQKNRSSFTYPAPPSFYGTSFLKQLLLELTENHPALQKPATEEDFAKLTKPLWQYLDALHPNMWRKGKVFVNSATKLIDLLDSGEITIALSFNPNEASRAVHSGELPESIRTYVHEKGTLANTHFVAIPVNSSSKEAAMVFANFLLSPEAQARKNNPAIWGDPTVLAMQKLSQKDQQLFHIENDPSRLSSEELALSYAEPHSSWVMMLEKAWLQRYRK